MHLIDKIAKHTFGASTGCLKIFGQNNGALKWPFFGIFEIYLRVLNAHGQTTMFPKLIL